MALAELPYRAIPPLFTDHFQYRGSVGLPGSETLPDTWSIVYGVATTSSEYCLEFTEEGEIDYVGDSLEDIDSEVLETVDDVTYSNYAVETQFLSDTGLNWILRSRLVGGSTVDNVELDVDVANSRFRIREISTSTGEENDYGWVTHKFTVGVYYIVSLWCFRGSYFVYINGFQAAAESSILGNLFQNSTGFGIKVNSFGAQARFFNFRAYKLLPAISRQLEDDQSDLFVRFRREWQESIRDVTIDDWESFKRAHALFMKEKDHRHSQERWWWFGYPGNEPTTEEWLKDD